ncbi:uncharacterized protein LOC8270841 isoform X2 [Ricinus communis]|uniref:Uncharacterized protein n=1 Tax=Ricinus communis TaxID=3988 RepID=B9S5P1_RICCO|nr:uncharacterized protein LOC8270841 isoform X2 [Ricinus communis]EEF41085.1 conserved hypothetical protein [Ricinus communis]|eukprot:XP_002521311.1 uncharacterized protein LOC8270841 [Ricinus communis]
MSMAPSSSAPLSTRAPLSCTLTATCTTSHPSPSTRAPSPASQPSPSQLTTSVTPGVVSGLGGCGSGRKRICLENRKFVESHHMSACISNIFREAICHEGYTWKAVTPEAQERYWIKFQKFLEWEDSIHEMVKLAWEQLAARRYTDMPHKWKGKGRPPCVPEDVWHRWQAKWSESSFRALAACQSRNHWSETRGLGSGPTRYTCGSISIQEHARRIERAEGAPPSKVRLFNETHITKVHDGSRCYIDDRARQFGESLKERLAEASHDEDGNPVPLFGEEERIFLETV